MYNFLENTIGSYNIIEETRFSFKSGYNCQSKITKGHNFMRNVGADMVFCSLHID